MEVVKENESESDDESENETECFPCLDECVGDVDVMCVKKENEKSAEKDDSAESHVCDVQRGGGEVKKESAT